jgi:SAM-dependent methyltransferase
MNIDQWHDRYQQQANWTASIRDYLFKQASIQPGDRVLEVGVGTGAVLQQFFNNLHIKPFGLEIARPVIEYAKDLNQAFHLVQADGHRIPLSDNQFRLTFCHYLLLWVNDPLQILREMQRVTQPGGFLAALAEPDHNARIDYPPPLNELGRMQTRAIKTQGADTKMGRKLQALFNAAGLYEVEAGILGAQWTGTSSQAEETEWMTITSDLGDRISQDQLEIYRAADQTAYQRGERVLFIPTFYAIGLVPGNA